MKGTGRQGHNRKGRRQKVSILWVFIVHGLGYSYTFLPLHTLLKSGILFNYNLAPWIIFKLAVGIRLAFGFP